MPLVSPQYFTASDPAFQAMVERWAADGAVARWRGPVGRLRDGAFTPDDSQERWIAPGGMRALAQYLAGTARRGDDLERERPWSGVVWQTGVPTGGEAQLASASCTNPSTHTLKCRVQRVCVPLAGPITLAATPRPLSLHRRL